MTAQRPTAASPFAHLFGLWRRSSAGRRSSIVKGPPPPTTVTDAPSRGARRVRTSAEPKSKRTIPEPVRCDFSHLNDPEKPLRDFSHLNEPVKPLRSTFSHLNTPAGRAGLKAWQESEAARRAWD